MIFFHLKPLLSFFKGENKESSNESNSEEDAAIAAALQSSLFYSQPPTNILYSQWLASRNTSALFGLQGKKIIGYYFSGSVTIFGLSEE